MLVTLNDLEQHSSHYFVTLMCAISAVNELWLPITFTNILFWDRDWY